MAPELEADLNDAAGFGSEQPRYLCFQAAGTLGAAKLRPCDSASTSLPLSATVTVKPAR
jgi:hypothetical protein